MKNLLFAALALLFLCTSCATKERIIYFQDAEQLDGSNIIKAYEPLIEPNDILYITLSSLEDDILRPYRRNVNTDIVANSGDASFKGYLVDVRGTINFPGLGEIKVAGKTRLQIVDFIKTSLKEFITAEVVVDVRITNFKITVLGEVQRPGLFPVSNERITLTEALALAGDLTENGSRENITIIREIDGKREVKRVDLTSTEFFNSSYYFLKQNDMVYVEPSLKGVKRSGFIPDIPALLGLFSVVLSTVIILTR